MKAIMLVDDSATILASMSQILGRAGYEVEQAESGEAALTKINGGSSPGLMIVDYNMGGMTGVELIRQARQVAATRFIPMLMLTTESQQEKRAEAKAAGATGWLVKPIPAAKLLEVIKQTMPGAS